MRILLLGFALLLMAPTNPPIPKAAVAEAPPLLNPDFPGIPEYETAIRWIDWSEQKEKRQGYTIRRVTHANGHPRSVFFCVVVRSSDGVERRYQFDFSHEGRLQRAFLVCLRKGHVDLYPSSMPLLPAPRHPSFPEPSIPFDK